MPIYSQQIQVSRHVDAVKTACYSSKGASERRKKEAEMTLNAVDVAVGANSRVSQTDRKYAQEEKISSTFQYQGSEVRMEKLVADHRKATGQELGNVENSDVLFGHFQS